MPPYLLSKANPSTNGLDFHILSHLPWTPPPSLHQTTIISNVYSMGYFSSIAKHIPNTKKTCLDPIHLILFEINLLERWYTTTVFTY